MEIMENLLDSLAGNACILFFADGLAFFAMGLALTLESRRVSTFAMSKSLLLLAGFGFAASVSNWMQMFYTGLGHSSSVVISPFGQALELVSFVLAGTLLLGFGVSLAIAHDTRYRWLRPGFWLLLAGYLAAAASLHPLAHRFESNWASVVEVWARYLVYSPALALASLVLLAQRRDFIEMRLFAPARDALGAAFAFGLKLMASSLIAVPILGLSGANASAWVLLLQFIRTLTTVAIAYFIVRILRVFEMERRRQLDLALQERFQAQEEALAAQQQACAEIRQWSVSIVPRGAEVVKLYAGIPLKAGGKLLGVMNLSSRDEHRHLGLLTMRERTESVGGSLRIDSHVGQGTKIELSLPLNRERRL
jgi:hypothetical protein